MVFSSAKQVTTALPDLPSPVVGNNLRLGLMRFKFMCRILNGLYANHRSIWLSFQRLRDLATRHREHFHSGLMQKMVEVDGRFFWHLHSPGAPSAASRRVFDYELAQISGEAHVAYLRLLIMSITKKCPLQCEHCYEWNYMHAKEVLTREDILGIVEKFQQYGTGIVWLAGGEPMVRLKDIVVLLEHARHDTDFWVVTSGYRLDAAAARKLKASGLTGVVISLDHYLPDKHNAFRGHPEAFAWAIRACEKAKNAGLVTALSLCATREFTTEDNFRQYMKLARRLGISFVQLLEPKAMGRYAGRDVDLSPEQVSLLEKLYIEYNTSPLFHAYPIIDYVEFGQRRTGCTGRGERKLYVDSDGNVSLCPFCRDHVASALHFSVEDIIQLARVVGCPASHNFENIARNQINISSDSDI